MKLLLDTHALIWFAEDDARLSTAAREALNDEANDLFAAPPAFGKWRSK